MKVTIIIDTERETVTVIKKYGFFKLSTYSVLNNHSIPNMLKWAKKDLLKYMKRQKIIK